MVVIQQVLRIIPQLMCSVAEQVREMTEQGARMSELATRIEALRRRAGLSQVALSQKAGLTASAVNDIVQNLGRSPRLATVQALANALGVSVAALIGAAGSDAAEVAGGRDSLREIAREGVEALLPAHKFLPPESELAGLAYFQVIGAGPCPFGNRPGEVLAVARGERARSGSKVVALIEREGGAEPVLRYYVEPYLFGFSPGGQPLHDYADGVRARIVGPVLASIRLESPQPRPRG
jgi:transcriptional regulator with XRE-family HTH domain